MWTISARWVAPVVSPPIPDGVVSFDANRITYVGPNDGRTIDERFDDAILLPGLVNAHTHLDLTGAAGQTPPRLSFPDWLRSVIAFRARRDEAATRQDILDGARRCMEAGTTLVGDISTGGLSYEVLLRGSPLERLVFFELIGLTRDGLASAFDRWARWIYDQKSLYFWSVSPHAPYSFRMEGFDQLSPYQTPVAMHVAESAEEVELLEHRSGPFVEFLQSLGVYDPSGLPGSMAEVVRRMCGLNKPLFVHANYLDPATPLPDRATLVYCPRTHAAFGHPPHPFRGFLARGVRVILGTDSLASNPDLSVLNEARFVARQSRDLDPVTLLHMITDWPANALGFGGLNGALRPHFWADVCVVAMADPSAEPLADLFFSDAPVNATYIQGRRVTGPARPA